MSPKETPAEMSRRMRDMALTVPAAELDVTPSPGLPHVWGTVMDLGYPETVASLAVFAEGSTSLYISTGGGIIGAGEHPTVRAASEKLLAAVEAQVSDFSAATSTPLPSTGRVWFYVRTFKALLGAEADMIELGEGRHKLSPIFHAGHAVITEMRLISEQRE